MPEPLSANPSDLSPGLLVLQGDRMETLAQTVLAWLARHPLGALEEEVLLVPSHGMGEWLKMELATAHGVCAATRVELPARFFWRACRAVLGRAAVPAQSPLDKAALAWRLMALLPQVAGAGAAAEYAPLAAWLQDGSPQRRWPLAQRLADLYDQYQVHRPDWLDDWAAGRDRLQPALPGAAPLPVPDDQRWQPALWRAVLAGLAPAQRDTARPALQRRFLQALQGPGPWLGLPRRVVMFGSTHLPHSLLQALAALGAHCQVLLAVPNPCRWFWADLIEGRELLPAAPRRHALRGGRDLAALSPAALHAHGHPLLAAWGRQARDFVRQLDAFDDAEQARQRFALPRLDLFSDEVPAADLAQRPWLAQLQAHILELRPLAEHTHPPLPAHDRSIVFHVCHSAQREVEVLHDQLLQLLAQPPGGTPLNPRDIVVMVPEIAGFAPAIRAVFGQHARGDPRHIPWGIADLRERGQRPLLRVLEWLLQAPQPRCTASELRDLLDLPPLARRFGLGADDLPVLHGWMDAAGGRWGLHAAHREALGLGACGEVNTWQFALRRLLLGHATGDLPDGFAGIEPCAEVAGLSAGLAGQLAELLDVLQAWWADAAALRTPADWADRLRQLLDAMFAATDDADRALLAALDEALAAWLQACDLAGFTDLLPLAVVREAWLDGVDAPDGAAARKRFRAGGVTFCTLLPLRAIPFEVVCLLGMNDGDYPRRALRSDFDLMAGAGQARPGDRSRRDDDRQLMLDALLSARRVLYVSWAGRSVRDNTVQPPSVLVGQLRDHLAAGWNAPAVHQRTTEHPLQPFSRRYFEGPAPTAVAVERSTPTASAVERSTPAAAAVDGPVPTAAVVDVPAPAAAATASPALFTYASEWRAAHAGAAPGDGPATSATVATAARVEPGAPLDLDTLARFLANPVKAHFRHRLRVVFEPDDNAGADNDDEAFALAGLDRWRLLDELLRGARARLAGLTPTDLPAAAAGAVQAQAAALARAGRLPLGAPGRQAQQALAATALPMLQAWAQWRASHPQPAPRLAWRQVHPSRPGLALDAVLADLWRPPGGAAVWIDLLPGALRAGRTLRADRLPLAWLRGLLATAAGQAVGGVLVGTDAVATLPALPLSPAAAQAQLQALLEAADDGLHGSAPLPTALRTGLALLASLSDTPPAAGSGPAQVFEGGRHQRGEGAEPCLARLFPDYASLAAAPGFQAACERLYAPFAAWLQTGVDLSDLPGADAAAALGDSEADTAARGDADEADEADEADADD